MIFACIIEINDRQRQHYDKTDHCACARAIYHHGLLCATVQRSSPITRCSSQCSSVEVVCILKQTYDKGR